MKRSTATIGIVLLALLAGCKSTTTAAGSGSTATAGTSVPATAPASSPATAPPSTPAASDAGPTTAATTKVDPCSLLTAADLTSALGASPGAGTSNPAGVYQECTYGKAKVIVLVRNIDKNSFDKSAAANPGTVKPVSGIGQDAYSADGDILTWKNGTEFVIAVDGGSLAVVEKLATAAAGRL
jgi:hypothetical protein